MKIFDFGSHPGRKDDTEPAANTIVSVPDPAVKADANGCLTLIHAIIKDRRNKLRDQRLQGGSTGVDLAPESSDTLSTDTSNNNMRASRGSSKAARTLRPNSRPDKIDAKFMEDLLVTALDRQKKKRKIVRLPQAIDKSGVFPQPLTESFSIDERMENCRSMLRQINEMKQVDVQRKTQTIMRAIKEIASPILEQQRLDNIKRDKERYNEGLGDALGMFAKGAAMGALKLGAHELGINRNIISFGKKIFKSATTTPKKKLLRSIVPKKPSGDNMGTKQTKPPMNFDAPEKGFVQKRLQGSGRLQYPDSPELAAWKNKWKM